MSDNTACLLGSFYLWTFRADLTIVLLTNKLQALDNKNLIYRGLEEYGRMLNKGEAVHSLAEGRQGLMGSILVSSRWQMFSFFVALTWFREGMREPFRMYALYFPIKRACFFGKLHNQVKGRAMETETEGYWLTVKEAALLLQIDPSRVRQLLLKDQERSEETRRFPAARKASTGEEKALFQSGRIGLRPQEGVWLLHCDDVTDQRERRGLVLGRPSKWRHYYAACVWFSGTSSPAREAFAWACGDDCGCCVAMLSGAAESYYLRCLPTMLWLDGGWEEMEPKRYTELLRAAYQRHECGRIACLMVPFHPTDPLDLAKIIVQAERHFAEEM